MTVLNLNRAFISIALLTAFSLDGAIAQENATERYEIFYPQYFQTHDVHPFQEHLIDQSARELLLGHFETKYLYTSYSGDDRACGAIGEALAQDFSYLAVTDQAREPYPNGVEPVLWEAIPTNPSEPPSIGPYHQQAHGVYLWGYENENMTFIRGTTSISSNYVGSFSILFGNRLADVRNDRTVFGDGWIRPGILPISLDAGLDFSSKFDGSQRTLLWGPDIGEMEFPEFIFRERSQYQFLSVVRYEESTYFIYFRPKRDEAYQQYINVNYEINHLGFVVWKADDLHNNEKALCWFWSA